MPHFTSLNGNIAPAESTSLLFNDLGLLRGYALFDYCRTYKGKPFMQDWYLDRLFHSAHLMHLQVPADRQSIKATMAELHKLSGFADVAFRFVLTGGYTPDGISASNPNFLITTENVAVQDSLRFTQGMRVITCEHLRELAEVKSTNYMRLLLMSGEIKKHAAHDILYVYQDEVSELSRSNIFAFVGDTLVTPHRNILKGITRKLTLQLAQYHFKIEERTLRIEELLAADEMFTTGTTKKITPVVQIDSKPIADGKPGKHTRMLMQVLDDFIEKSEW
jgi:branched-subunit amino acid aminotransferase/4-amino-4-deoxychorismate lyase